MTARAQALVEAQLRCRTYGHSWDEVPGQIRGGDWEMRLRCGGCGTERVDVIELRTGGLRTRRYLYLAPYKLSRDVRFTRDQLRKELARRRSIKLRRVR